MSASDCCDVASSSDWQRDLHSSALHFGEQLLVNTCLLIKLNGKLGKLIIVLVEWNNVPGGPGATRVGVWWCVLDVLGRL